MQSGQVISPESAFSELLAGALPAPVVPAFNKLLGFDGVLRLYRELRDMPEGRPLPELLIGRLKVDCRIGPEDRRRIPAEGPVVAVSNHPYGLLDAALLAAWLPTIRPDVKFLGNYVLGAIPEIRERLIVVDPMREGAGRAVSVAGLKAAIEFVRGGGMLVVFPAGEVSHLRLRNGRIEDREWHSSVGGIIRRTGAAALPIHVSGANSILFQLAGLVHPMLRTAMLPRELLNKERKSVTIRVGSPVPAAKLVALGSDEERASYLRWRTYLLGSRSDFKPRTSLPFVRSRSWKAPIAAAQDSGALRREVASLGAARMLIESGDLESFLAPANEIPTVLAEIGRLREISFRAVGEGTGRAADLDRFDRHYLHLFLWNRKAAEVVGAYRIAQTDVVRNHLGRDGLYTATLFRYSDELLDRMGPALELGRSFIRPEYQTQFGPLLTLWKGIGRFIAMRPEYRVLFGPVSISNSYPPACRQLMVSFLSKYLSLSDWTSLVRARRPPRGVSPGTPTGLDLDDLCSLVEDIDREKPGIPVLLRQYLKLGGKLLGFNVDREFGDALDGLIVVDLMQTDPKILGRYIGKREAEAFRNFHDPSVATSAE
jgi:putative hemolysin